MKKVYILLILILVGCSQQEIDSDLLDTEIEELKVVLQEKTNENQQLSNTVVELKAINKTLEEECDLITDERESIEFKYNRLHESVEEIIIFSNYSFFIYEDVEIGDEICGMSITNKISKYQVDFQGEVSITGTLEYEYSDYYSQYIVDFLPNQNEINKLPKLLQNQGSHRFVLRNKEAAMVMMTEEIMENVTIIIDNYQIDNRPTDTSSSAELIMINIE